MRSPVVLAVESDSVARAAIDRELSSRYGLDYRVRCVATAAEADSLLDELSRSDDDVALILASPHLDGETGAELLERAGRLHPRALRALLVSWGEQGSEETGDLLFDAIARGHIDHYLIRPSEPPDEFFHREISGLLLDWADRQRTSPHTVFVVGESWSGRAYELREALGKCAMPHRFCLADSDQGREIIARSPAGSALPLVVFPNGLYLVDPTNAELAVASGSPVHPERMEFDLLIVGAGPAGLSAAVYGASEGFSTLVVDEGGLGGQASSSSLIRNFLGFPRGVSGRRLAQSAYEQAWVFGAKFTFIQRVTDLRPSGSKIAVSLTDGACITARAVLLATGVSYRMLGVPALEAFVGSGVFYGGSMSEAPRVAGRDVFVLGGANSAGQTALYLARFARSVTLVVRAGSLDAGMSHYLVQQIGATPNIDVRVGTEVVGGGGDGRLERVVLRDRESGVDDEVAADALFVMIGAQPRTQWLPSEVLRDERGYVLTGGDLPADPLREHAPLLLETSMPGVFAAGDIRHGSVKRVASAVGEGSVAIQLLHQYFAAQQLYPLGRPHDLVDAGSTPVH